MQSRKLVSGSAATGDVRQFDTQLLYFTCSSLSADDRYLYVRGFDTNGNWEEKPTRIAFSELVSISFGTRYVEVFSKYLPPCPVEHDISLLPPKS